jgi:hypothetical protein
MARALPGPVGTRKIFSVATPFSQMTDAARTRAGAIPNGRTPSRMTHSLVEETAHISAPAALRSRATSSISGKMQPLMTSLQNLAAAFSMSGSFMPA